MFTCGRICFLMDLNLTIPPQPPQKFGCWFYWICLQFFFCNPGQVLQGLQQTTVWQLFCCRKIHSIGFSVLPVPQYAIQNEKVFLFCLDIAVKLNKKN